MSGNKFEFQTDTKKIKTLGKSLFSDNVKKEEIVMLPVTEIHEVESIRHPFAKSLYDGVEELAALIQAAGGIQQPTVVRPRPAGGYEILIGRRRRLAAIMLCMETIPAIIREVDDATAQLIITDNLGQRPKIYPSERAMAYKLEIEALKQQGKSRDFEGAVKKLLEMHFVQSLPEVANLEAREIVARIHGIKPRMISYYLRLNYLIPALLDHVDEEQISVRAGTEISYLQPGEQKMLEEILTEKKIELSTDIARELREAAQDMLLSKPIIDAIVDPPGDMPDKLRSKKIKQPYQLAFKRAATYCKKLEPEKAARLAAMSAEELEQLLTMAIETVLMEQAREEEH